MKSPREIKENNQRSRKYGIITKCEITGDREAQASGWKRGQGYEWGAEFSDWF